MSVPKRDNRHAPSLRIRSKRNLLRASTFFNGGGTMCEDCVRCGEKVRSVRVLVWPCFSIRPDCDGGRLEGRAGPGAWRMSRVLPPIQLERNLHELSASLNATHVCNLNSTLHVRSIPGRLTITSNSGPRVPPAFSELCEFDAGKAAAVHRCEGVPRATVSHLAVVLQAFKSLVHLLTRRLYDLRTRACTK